MIIVIILKILLYIILAVLGIILLVSVIPAGVEFSFIDEKLKYKVKLSALNILDSEGKGFLKWLKKRKSAKKKSDKSKKGKNDPDDFFVDEELEPYVQPDETADDSNEESYIPSTASENVSSPEIEDSDTDFFDDLEEPVNEVPEKKKKKKPREKNIEADFDDEDEDEDGDTDEKKGKTLGEKVDFIIGIWESAQRPLLKIFKGFKMKDLYIDFIVADEDAYDCAIKYGKICAVTYNGIAMFSQLFTVRLKTVDVQCGFGLQKGRWDASFKLSFCVGTVLLSGAWFLLSYIFRIFLPEKLRKIKSKKSAERQK